MTQKIFNNIIEDVRNMLDKIQAQSKKPLDVSVEQLVGLTLDIMSFKYDLDTLVEIPENEPVELTEEEWKTIPEEDKKAIYAEFEGAGMDMSKFPFMSDGKSTTNTTPSYPSQTQFN